MTKINLMPGAEIFFTSQISHDLAIFLASKKYTTTAVIVDENTSRHCLPIIKKVIGETSVISIRSGEQNKNLRTCEMIWEEMTRLNMDRKSVILNLGGGVIGDMGGFCAATYKRGIDFIQIPTTLLSQVDASVGGKLGIDFLDFKNHIGVFHEPAAVFIDPAFLTTLSHEELRSGFAEVIKHCLIADADMWHKIKNKKPEELEWANIIVHSVSIKSDVTTQDPHEAGLRKILNFGHTVGHAVESYFLNIPGKKLLHGEAIAIGMICEACISFKKKFIGENDLQEISDYLIRIFGKVEIFDFDLEKILPITLQDKKNNNNTVLCSLLASIGKGNFNISVSMKEIRESIQYYNSLHAAAKIT